MKNFTKFLYFLLPGIVQQNLRTANVTTHTTNHTIPNLRYNYNIEKKQPNYPEALRPNQITPLGSVTNGIPIYSGPEHSHNTYTLVPEYNWNRYSLSHNRADFYDLDPNFTSVSNNASLTVPMQFKKDTYALQQQNTLDSNLANLHKQVINLVANLQTLREKEKLAEKREKKDIKKRKKFILKLLKTLKKQEDLFATRQTQVYKLNKFTHNYKINCKNGTIISIKSNIKLSSNQKDEIQYLLENFENTTFLVQSAELLPAEIYRAMQNSSVRSSQIKNSDIAATPIKYMTTFEALNKEKKGEIDLQKFSSAKTLSSNKKNESLTKIKKNLKKIHKREKELKKLGNFQYKYEIAGLGTTSKTIKSTRSVKEDLVEMINKPFFNNDNMNLRINVKVPKQK